MAAIGAIWGTFPQWAVRWRRVVDKWVTGRFPGRPGRVVLRVPSSASRRRQKLGQLLATSALSLSRSGAEGIVRARRGSAEELANRWGLVSPADKQRLRQVGVYWILSQAGPLSRTLTCEME